jgi:hypothetical protein
VLDRLPARVQEQFAAERVLTAQHARVTQWEANRVHRALRGVTERIVLLKGGAYAAAKLPPAAGRRVSDTDVLVARGHLDGVERALRQHGWESVEEDEYDDAYYRRWMHELPPMRHRARLNVLDVHHTILPRTSRLRPDAGRLLTDAEALDDRRLHVLCPADMVLHSAAHMFQDGDLASGLRELLDLDDLLRHFAGREGFWPGLADRAARMDLARPLYYALRYCRMYLDTPVPSPTCAEIDRIGGPARPVLAMMDRLVDRAIVLRDPDRDDRLAVTAHILLYIRSHWLRMPPHLLAPHLCRKAWRRLFQPPEEDEDDPANRP